MVVSGGDAVESVAPACPFGPGGRDFKPFQEQNYHWLHALLKKARHEAPVFHSDDLNLWVVSKRDDVVEILRDDERFSSSVRHVILANLVDEAREILAGTDTFASANMGFDHVPDHTRLRRPFVKYFSARGVQVHETNIRRVAGAELDGWPADPPVDLVHDYARPLAIKVIMDIIGLPAADYELVAHYGEAVHSFFFGSIPPDDQIRFARDLREWEEYLKAFVEHRRREEADDLTTYLLRKIDRGEADYRPDEIIGFLSFDIVGAGMRSTSFALPNLCHELLRERRYWDALRENPALHDSMFAEALRRSALGLGLFRQTTADAEVAGVRIPAGEIVWVMTSSANYDEDYFPEPEVFDPTRQNLHESVGFGHSLHFCLGQNLARLVTRIGTLELMRRYPALALTEDQRIEYDPSINVMVMKRLLVQW